MSNVKNSIILVCALLYAAAAFGQLAATQQWGIAYSKNDPVRQVEDAKAMGFDSLRIDAPWAEIEKSRGNYEIPEWLEMAVNKSTASRMKPVLILAYGNSLYGGDKPVTREAVAAFARYAAFLARNYKGQGVLFEIWNEWHAPTGRTTRGSARDYVQLARSVYPAIKAADPTATVLAGSFSVEAIEHGWVEEFIEREGYKNSDAVSIHPYVYMYRGRKRTADAAIEIVDELKRALTEAGAPSSYPIYITEFGYPEGNGRFAMAEEERAANLAKFLAEAKKRDYIKGVWVYGLYDQGDDPKEKEHRFGLIDRNHRIKATGTAVTEWLSRKSQSR